LVVGMSSIDFDYIETMDIRMLEGRAFSREFPGDVISDDDGSFIINRKLAEIMNEESVIGQELRFVGVSAPIVGVMNDFHFRSVHNDIEPLALFIYPPFFNHMLIRLAPGDIQKSLATVRKVWQESMPNYPFEYRFLDEDFEWMYRSDKAMSQLISYFAILAIIIACLGLFGLASFTAEQRSKEIGIRKVLGASVPKLVGLMTSQFTRWVLFANLIAFPLAYLVMRSYLQKYAYRIPLNWSLFVVAGVLALVIALLTVSYQAIRAATANPAKTIRYE